MTPGTRIAVLVTAGYVVLAVWMLEYHEAGLSWSNLAHHSAFFLPLLILWIWWLYKKGRRY